MIDEYGHSSGSKDPGPYHSARIAAAFANATNLTLISINGDGIIQFVNPSATKLFGYTSEEMIGSPITIIIPERMRGAHTGGLARVASGEKPNLGGKSVEVVAMKKDGTEFPIEITLSVWHDEYGMSAGAIIKDITDRRDRDSRLLRLANQDTLTGLHNRHRFVDLLRAELGARRPATVIMLDLDGFKDVNDTHGHAVGDTLLQAIAVRIPHILSRDAEIARFGGDEFAILLPGVGDPLAADVEAAAILKAFAAPFDLGGHLFDLGASLGFAVAPAHGLDEEELIASADFALYRAKSAGGRTRYMFDHSMRGETLALRSLRDELLLALRNNELVLHYQPQVDLKTGRIFGLEALIRWQHSVRGLLLPGTFLPALERSSLALEIGWWTLEESCRQLARLAVLGHGTIKVGVNLFPAQLQAPNLPARVAGYLEKHNVAASSLELEITETIALHDHDKSLEVLTALRQMGVGIAFDDFGTGFASLSSLQSYPLTTLKIDRGFIQDILRRPQNAAITRALISMSRELGLETIAEGIETEEQEAALLALGCPAAQGYLYGRPMPAAQIEHLLGGTGQKTGRLRDSHRASR